MPIPSLPSDRLQEPTAEPRGRGSAVAGGRRWTALGRAALGASLALLGACATGEPAPREATPAATTAATATPTAPTLPVVDDATLAARVTAKLAASAELHAFDVAAGAADGTVTLRGAVETDFQRSEAERIARETAGVRAVRNELVVASRPSPTVSPS